MMARHSKIKVQKLPQREASLQLEISKYIQVAYPAVIFTAESSGIRVSMGTAMKMKRQRSTHKHLDMIIDEARGGFHGMRLELKAQDDSPYLMDNTISKKEHVQEQYKMILYYRAKGFYSNFAVGFEDAKKQIDAYMRFPETKTSV